MRVKMNGGKLCDFRLLRDEAAMRASMQHCFERSRRLRVKRCSSYHLMRQAVLRMSIRLRCRRCV